MHFTRCVSLFPLFFINCLFLKLLFMRIKMYIIVVIADVGSRILLRAAQASSDRHRSVGRTSRSAPFR